MCHLKYLRLEQQVLVRFEKENGGELLVGALCLLEVSQRGLLEAELLAIMGDEDNLMPHFEAATSNKEKGMILYTTKNNYSYVLPFVMKC